LAAADAFVIGAVAEFGLTPHSLVGLFLTGLVSVQVGVSSSLLQY
jgi:hypothetical protein